MSTDAEKKDKAAQGAGQTQTQPKDQGAGQTQTQTQTKTKDKGKAPTKAQEKAERELEIMARHKVKTLFVNKKGEYFTSENLAHLSDKKENVTTITHADAIKVAKG